MPETLIQLIGIISSGLEWFFTSPNPIPLFLGCGLGYSLVSYCTYRYRNKQLNFVSESEKWRINCRWTGSGKHLGLGVSLIVIMYTIFWGKTPNFILVMCITTFFTWFCVLLTAYIIDLNDIIRANRMEERKGKSIYFMNEHHDEIDSLIEVLYEIRDEIRSKE